MVGVVAYISPLLFLVLIFFLDDGSSGTSSRELPSRRSPLNRFPKGVGGLWRLSAARCGSPPAQTGIPIG